MRVEKAAIKSVAGAAFAASAEGCASSRLHQGLEPSGGTCFNICVSHGASLLPRKLTNLCFLLDLPQQKPGVSTAPRTASSVSGPHWLWQIQSKRSLATQIFRRFGQGSEKTRLQSELGVRFLGSGRLGGSALAFLGCSGGRRGGRAVGSCAGSRKDGFPGVLEAAGRKEFYANGEPLSPHL